MKYKLLTTNFNMTPEVSREIDETMNKLEKFIDRPIQAWVEVGKTTEHHQKGEIYRAEIQISLPGNSVRSTAVRETIFEAINEAEDDIERRLKKYKGKKMDRIRKGARFLKRLINRRRHEK